MGIWDGIRTTKPRPKKPALLVAVVDETDAPGKKPLPVQRDRGSIFWLVVVPLAVVYELAAIAVGKTAWTLSGVTWSFLEPRYSTQWWLVGLPLAALLLWLPPHFLFRADGWVLLWMVLAALVVAAVGILA